MEPLIEGNLEEIEDWLWDHPAISSSSRTAQPMFQLKLDHPEQTAGYTMWGRPSWLWKCPSIVSFKEEEEEEGG